MKAKLYILDYGSQYTQLIARAVRELGVYCEILPGTIACERLRALGPQAIILSGGPASVGASGAPKIDPEILGLGVPVFGICYGMQLIAEALGGEVGGWGRNAINGAHCPADESQSCDCIKADAADIREFGPADVVIDNPEGPFSNFAKRSTIKVWMSHGDKVTKLPPEFRAIAGSPGSPVAAFGDLERRIYGVQFHPEVHHTPRGKEILAGFLFETAGLKKDWDPKCFATETIERIRRQVSSGNVVCGLSGGVDSTVAAVLVHRAIGDRLHCIFVDNGLLRAGEAEEVMSSMSQLGLNVKMVDASERFLSKLSGATDPERKRKIIGAEFIDVFEEEAHRITDVKYLVQGTLYPDVIESVSVVGESATIKSHHNVGGLKDEMKLELIEPLRELFKDEVRRIGRELGIPEWFVERQPFPGPGLGVRCLGEITGERLRVLRQADRIVREEVQAAGLNKTLWQAFAVLLPVRSVGVMGDGRTFDETAAIRAVTSRDGMTADWFMFSEEFLRKVSSRIVNETRGVNRVVLDISTKPPATIEWE